MSLFCIGHDLATKVWPVEVSPPGWSTSFTTLPLVSGLEGSREITLTASGDRWALWWDGTPAPEWISFAMSSGPMAMPGLEVHEEDGYLTLHYGAPCLSLLRKTSQS